MRWLLLIFATSLSAFTIVPFDKNGTRFVREVYRNEAGGINDQYQSGAIVEAASYILHTGASWHKPIGSAKVVVTFAPDAEMVAPLEMQFLRAKMDAGKQVWQKFKTANFVAVTGPVKPSVDGLVLTFQETNWRPGKNDDILVLFRYSPKQLEKLKAQAAQQQKRKH